MLVSEMLSEIREFGFDDLTDTRILGFLNDAYWDICSREAWPFLEASASAVVDSTGLVTSPTNVAKVLRFVDTTIGTRLEPTRLDEFTSDHPTNMNTTGNPYAYFFIADQLYVYPVSTSNNLVLRYIRVPAALTTVPDSVPILPERHHRLVVLGALVSCYALEDDAENVNASSQTFESRLARVRNDLWGRQYDRTDTILDVDGYDEVDWLY